MDLTTVLWLAAATLLAGVQLFFQKVVAQQKRNSAFNGMLMYGLSGAMAFIILFALYSIPERWEYVGLFALAAGAVHAIGNFIRIEALKHIDSIIYFPLNKMLGPLLVVIGGVVWFADPLSTREYVGIALSLCVPLLLVSSVEHHRQNNLRMGLIFVVVSTALTSIGVLLTKQGLLYDKDVLFLMGISQFAGLVSSTIIFLREQAVRAGKNFGMSKEDVRLGLLAGVLAFLSFSALLKAMSTGFISLVYVIHAHYILVPIILSVWWYREHVNSRKVIAVVVSCLAITLLV